MKMDAQAQYYALQKSAEQQMAALETSDAARRQYIRFNFMLYIEMGEQRVQSDNHEKRLQNIRNELVHLKNTDWQYDPIEKYIGQA